MKTLTPPVAILGRKGVASIELSSDEDLKERRRREEEVEESDRGIRLEFDGRLNTDEFPDWVSAIERIFEYKAYCDEKSCRAAILKLKDRVSLVIKHKKAKGLQGKVQKYVMGDVKESHF